MAGSVRIEVDPGNGADDCGVIAEATFIVRDGDLYLTVGNMPATLHPLNGGDPIALAKSALRERGCGSHNLCAIRAAWYPARVLPLQDVGRCCGSGQPHASTLVRSAAAWRSASANSSRSSSSTCCRNPDRGVDDERMTCSSAVVTTAARSQLPDFRSCGRRVACSMATLLSDGGQWPSGLSLVTVSVIFIMVGFPSPAR